MVAGGEVTGMSSSPLRLSSFQCRVVQIPLRVKVSHHLAQRVVAENVLVTVRGADGREGWGECCPREYVTGETVATVEEALGGHFIPQYLRREFDSFEDVVEALSESAAGLAKNEQAAFCAIELAVLDLAGKHFDRSISEVIGGSRRDDFRYTGVLAADDLPAVDSQGQRLREFGFTTVKVKVTQDLEFNCTALQTVRQLFGDEASVRVDANGAWTAQEAIRHLKGMADYRLDGVEQPVAGDDLAGMTEVTAAGLTPVVADESLCSMDDAEGLIKKRGCIIFNIRISKCGGLINSARIARKAFDAGLKCQLGAQVGESGFLSAAGRHFAAVFPELVWLEGSFDAYLLEQQITTPDITIQPGGRAERITGAGLGILPLPEAIEATCIRQQEFY